MSAVGPARPGERADALRLAFGHLDPDEIRRRSAAALAMIDAGEFDPDGLLVSRSDDRLDGAMIAVALSGRGGAVWPPAASSDKVADTLVAAASVWLRDQGVRVAQALLDTSELQSAKPLIRAGFVHLTSLLHLRHELELATDWLGRPERLGFAAYGDVEPRQFADVLSATFEESLDCPEVSGARTAAESVEAHHPTNAPWGPWWLADRHGLPVGVLLLNPSDEGGWNVAYVGVVPQARRRGHGRELMRKALFEAKAAGVPWLDLAVDARNGPARALYHSLGFELVERKEVVLAVWDEV